MGALGLIPVFLAQSATRVPAESQQREPAQQTWDEQGEGKEAWFEEAFVSAALVPWREELCLHSSTNTHGDHSPREPVLWLRGLKDQDCRQHGASPDEAASPSWGAGDGR